MKPDINPGPTVEQQVEAALVVADDPRWPIDCQRHSLRVLAAEVRRLRVDMEAQRAKWDEFRVYRGTSMTSKSPVMMPCAAPKPMKPIKAWAVQIDEDSWVVEYTPQDAKCRAELWRAYDGRKSRIVRVEIREVPPKPRKRVTR